MTQQEREEELRSIAEMYRDALKKAHDEYDKEVRNAADMLALNKQVAKDLRDRCIQRLPPPERNHDKRTKSIAYDFMRFIKKSVFEFKPDAKEIETDESGRPIVGITQNFTISDNVVVLDMTVVLTRKQH